MIAETVYAVLEVFPDGSEGICAVNDGRQFLPLVTTRVAAFASLLKAAQELAEHSSPPKKLRVVRASIGETLWESAGGLA